MARRPTNRPTPSGRSSQQERKEKVRGEEDREDTKEEKPGEIRTRTDKEEGKKRKQRRLIKDETNFCCFLF